jgi:hypothetical protein
MKTTINLYELLGQNSFLLFQLLNIDATFLFDDAVLWTDEPRYIDGQQRVGDLRWLMNSRHAG